LYTAHHDITRTLQLDDARYVLEVASTQDIQAKGLSGRASLPEYQGMLFTYTHPGRQCFWMKDMRFPLDIVWLDAHKVVLHMQQNVSPDTYPQSFCADSASYVIELNAGETAKRQIHAGEQLQF
jgi:uncharacterized membrane protein (UPF0127 family)